MAGRAAIAVGLVAGGAMSLQSFTNGRLGQAFGSAELAAMVSNLVGIAVLAIVSQASGATGRASARMRAGERIRRRHVLASAPGGLVLIALVYAAPKIGIAMLTVSFVCGQTIGGLIVDRIGLSTAGRHPLSIRRVVAAVVATVAVGISAIGADGSFQLLPVALVVIGGVGFCVVSSSISQLTRITGEPVTAALINNSIGGALVVILALALTGGAAPDGWSAPWFYWVAGGLCGSGVGVVLGLVVRSIGILRITLLLIAGQSAGALALDLIHPPEDAPVTVATVVSLVLVFVAVAISTRGGPATAGGNLRGATQAPDPAPAPAVSA